MEPEDFYGNNLPRKGEGRERRRGENLVHPPSCCKKLTSRCWSFLEQLLDLWLGFLKVDLLGCPLVTY